MYYAVSDAYIHPGHEQYSLTTYEAAIAGIPIIATSGVGCVKDCLYDGVNGFVVQEDNLKQLYDSVIKLYEHKYDAYKCQMISRNIVNNKGVVWACNNLLSAIKFAMNNH
jgi:glycosyltransferase involved in cell wall biosynthesis